jgi:hypothetical protein
MSFIHYFKLPFTNPGYLATLLLVTSAFIGLRLAGGKFLVKSDKSMLPVTTTAVELEKSPEELAYIERRKMREKLKREILGSLENSEIEDDSSDTDSFDSLDDIEKEVGIR